MKFTLYLLVAVVAAHSVWAGVVKRQTKGDEPENSGDGGDDEVIEEVVATLEVAANCVIEKAVVVLNDGQIVSDVDDDDATDDDFHRGDHVVTCAEKCDQDENCNAFNYWPGLPEPCEFHQKTLLDEEFRATTALIQQDDDTPEEQQSYYIIAKGCDETTTFEQPAALEDASLIEKANARAQEASEAQPDAESHEEEGGDDQDDDGDDQEEGGDDQEEQ